MGRGAAGGASCPSATAGASILSVVLCKDAPNRLGSAIEQRALARRRSSRRRGRRGRRGRRQWLCASSRRFTLRPSPPSPASPPPEPGAVARGVLYKKNCR